MIKKSYQVKHPMGAFFFSLVALLWSAYVAFPGGQGNVCNSSGCLVFQDFHFQGASLWWIGGAFFFLLTLLSLRGYYFIAWQLARIALFLDCLLLIIMLFLAPCTDCLIAGVFFALSYFCLRPEQAIWNQEKSGSKLPLLFFWLGLFISNSSLAINEDISLWAVQKTETATVDIFFSPECPHCLEALNYFGEHANLYPITQDPNDLQRIINFLALRKYGLNIAQALEESKLEANNVSLSRQEKTILFIALARNKAALLKQGTGILPRITIHGFPQQWKKEQSKAQDIDVTPVQQSETPSKTQSDTELQNMLNTNSTWQNSTNSCNELDPNSVCE